MRRIGFLLIAFFFLPFHVLASSPQAYQDYIYQFDIYRQNYSDFKVAKNEYDKFKTLTSQTTLLEKTKTMLTQRDQMLRAYLLLLNEKLLEDKGLASYDKNLYFTLIHNETKFLDGHSALIPSIGSLNDASDVSKQLESHYDILQASMRQTLVALSLGSLNVLKTQYNRTFDKAQAVLQKERGTMPPEKQATVDRWLLQIDNKRSLYQQKVDSITQANGNLKGKTPELDKMFRDMQKNLAEAKQYLTEGASFLGELVNTIRYAD